MLKTMQSLTQMSQYFSRQGKGQKRKEAQAGTEACSPVLRTLDAVHTCRTRWRWTLHTWQPCTCPRACRAIPDVSHSHAWRPQSLWPPRICQRGRHRYLLSVSLLDLPIGSKALRRTKAWLLLHPLTWEERMLSSELNLLKGLLPMRSRSAEPALLQAWAGWWGDHRGGRPLPRSRESAFHKHLPMGAFGPVDACR